jgi:hypothetical protein
MHAFYIKCKWFHVSPTIGGLDRRSEVGVQKHYPSSPIFNFAFPWEIPKEKLENADFL